MSTNAKGRHPGSADDGDLSIDPEWTTEILIRFIAAEVGRISMEAGSSQATLDLLANAKNDPKPKRQPRPLPEGE